MDSNPHTVSTLLTKPRWLPDFTYPRWKSWFKTKVYHSPSTATLQPHSLPSAQHLLNLSFARRSWNGTTTATARSSEEEIDLTTPAYMLAGTDTDNATGDTVVGLDYYNAPILMDKAIYALSRFVGISAGAARWVSRTLAINHRFHILNYNRHPVEIFYTILPIGWSFPDLESLTVPMDDPRATGYTRLVIPGVMDQGDKAVRRHFDVKLNLADMFPEQYEQPLTNYLGNDTSNPGTPWFIVNSTNNYISCPPGQNNTTENASTTSGNSSQVPGLKMRVCARLLTGINVGDTTYTAATGDTGDLDTNGIVIYGEHNWLQELASLERFNSLAHNGDGAYPDQAP